MEIAYKKDGSQNYMIIKEQKIDESNYKLQMIINNNINSIIPISIKIVNNEYEIYYDVNSMTSMETMYAKKGMSGMEIYELIKSIKILFENMKEYLLDGENIILDVSCIFIDRRTNKYKFCYYPGKNGDIQDNLRLLFDKMLEYINHEDKKAVLTAYGIQRITINNDFTIQDILDCAEGNIREAEKEYKETLKNENKVNSVKEDIIIGENKNKKNIIEKLLEKFRSGGKLKNKSEPESDIFYENDFAENTLIREDMSEFGNEEEGATMLLTSMGPIAAITLRSVNLEETLKITPNVFPCVLGNSKKSSDFLINNPVISRVHMRISEVSAGYFVEDLNSTNGTFVNGMRLKPHEAKEIHVGDQVTLANIDFLVE